MFMTAVGGGGQGGQKKHPTHYSGVQNLDNGCICTKSVFVVGELDEVGKHLAIALRKIVHDDPLS